MSLAINRYEPTPDEIEAEARLFEREPDNHGPLKALLILRIRNKMLAQEYADLLNDYRKVVGLERSYARARKGDPVSAT